MFNKIYPFLNRFMVQLKISPNENKIKHFGNGRWGFTYVEGKKIGNTSKIYEIHLQEKKLLIYPGE